jgi:eukaryotic-like serine/threonine-protein kinase
MVGAKLFEPGAGRTRVDRYELIGEIASGGMATVYLARLTGVGGFARFVAMKRLHPHLAGEKEFVEMFLDEARLAAGIHHPNVVSILEVGASPVGYYIVMEYIEGDTLARLLARAAGHGRRLPTPIAVRIVLDGLAGLHAAHELRDDQGRLLGLVHRDVSPQNILVGIDGIGRITDFGVARASSRLTSTRVGQLKGKLAYMAPEQAAGDDLDRRADVFSAGILIWETLASKRLFKAENEAATLSRVLSEPIPDLTQVAPQLSPGLSSAVKRALERNRDRRYASAAELAEAIERAALASDGIASTREVAAFVSSMMGQEIAQQRDAVRAWLARSEPSQVAQIVPPAAPSSVSVAAMSFPGASSLGGLDDSMIRRSFAPRSKRAATVAGGIGLLALAGVAGFVVARSSQAPAPAPVPVPVVVPATVPPPVQASAVVAPPAPTPAPDPTPATPAAPAPTSLASAVAAAAATAIDKPPVPRPPAVIVPRAPKVAPAPAPLPKKKQQSEDEELDVRNPYR